MGRGRFLRSVGLVAAGFAAAVSLAGPTYAVTIDVNRPAADAVVTDLWASPLNGVGRVGRGCTGSAISPLHVLTAAHCFAPGVDRTTFRLPYGDVPPVAIHGSVTTYPGYDRAKTSHQQKTTPDLAILSLDTALPEFVRTYRLVPADIRLEGATFQLAGYGNTGTGATGERLGTSGDTLRFGLNEVDWFKRSGTGFIADFDDGLSPGSHAYPPSGPRPPRGIGHNRTGSGGLGLREAMTAKGDSGGPAFYNPSIALEAALARDGDIYAVDPADLPDENFIIGVSSYGTRYGSDPFSSFGSTAAWTFASRFAGWIDNVIMMQPEDPFLLEGFSVISDREIPMPEDFRVPPRDPGLALVPIPASGLYLIAGLAALLGWRRPRPTG